MTGGHDFVLSDKAPPPPGFQLWSHLLDEHWHPPVPLNRWRETDYQAAFLRHFDIVERIVTSEHGREYVSDALLARLPGYTIDELSTEAVVYVLRRRLETPSLRETRPAGARDAAMRGPGDGDR
jgi:hypothetical protein